MSTINDQIKEDLLTCQICLDSFTKPKLLPCQHSFCGQCLHGYVETSQELRLDRRGNIIGTSFHCPICRNYVITPRKGVYEFPDNYNLNSLQDIILQHSPAAEAIQPGCYSCTDNTRTRQAVARCMECDDLFCSSCREYHSRNKWTQNHNVILLEEIEKDPSLVSTYRASVAEPCDQHKGEFLKFFCKLCYVAICGECIVSDHDGHACTTIQSTAEDCSTKLGELLQVTQKTIARKEFKHDSLERDISDLERCQEKLKKDIGIRAENLIQRIKTHRDSMFYRLAQSLVGRKSSLVDAKSRLDTELQDLRSRHEFAESTMETGTRNDKVGLIQMVEDSLAYVRRMHQAGELDIAKKKKVPTATLR